MSCHVMSCHHRTQDDRYLSIEAQAHETAVLAPPTSPKKKMLMLGALAIGIALSMLGGLAVRQQTAPMHKNKLEVANDGYDEFYYNKNDKEEIPNNGEDDVYYNKTTRKAKMTKMAKMEIKPNKANKKRKAKKEKKDQEKEISASLEALS
eukprot:g62855.t1